MSNETQLTTEVQHTVTRVIETVTLDTINEALFAELRAHRNGLEAKLAQLKAREYERRDYALENNIEYAIQSLSSALGRLIR